MGYLYTPGCYHIPPSCFTAHGLLGIHAHSQHNMNTSPEPTPFPSTFDTLLEIARPYSLLTTWDSTCSKSRVPNGLRQNPASPSTRALSASITWLNPVHRIIGMSGRIPRRARASCSPVS